MPRLPVPDSVNQSPSASVSFASNATSIGVFSGVETRSGAAFGASLTSARSASPQPDRTGRFRVTVRVAGSVGCLVRGGRIRLIRDEPSARRSIDPASGASDEFRRERRAADVIEKHAGRRNLHRLPDKRAEGVRRRLRRGPSTLIDTIARLDINVPFETENVNESDPT